MIFMKNHLFWLRPLQPFFPSPTQLLIINDCEIASSGWVKGAAQDYLFELVLCHIFFLIEY